MKRIILTVGCMALLLLAIACSNKPETTQQLPAVQGAKIETVQPSSVDDFYEAVGTGL